MIIYGINSLLVFAILIPNLLYIIYPPKNIPQKHQNKGKLIVIAFEKIGQLGIFTIPLFYLFKIDNSTKLITLFIMCIALIFYYICWTRYLFHQFDFKYLFTSFLKIPIPLAISPIIYFVCLSIILESWIMMSFTIIFAIGHIHESLSNIVKE